MNYIKIITEIFIILSNIHIALSTHSNSGFATFILNTYSTRFNNLSSHGKQVVTLGPSSNNCEVITSLINNGASVFRLNFSHGNRLSKIKLFNVIKQAEKDSGKLVAILGDIQGPKIRIGKFMPNVNATGLSPNSPAAEYAILEKGQKFIFDTYDVAGDANRVQLPYKNIIKLIQPGHRITVDDGNLHFIVKNTSQIGDDYIVETELLNKGRISSRKGFSCPDVIFPMDIFLEKDVKDIAVCLALNINLLAISFVQTHKDVIHTKNILSHFTNFEKRDKLVEKVKSLGNKLINIEDSQLLNENDTELEQLLSDFYESLQLLDKKNVDYDMKIGIIPKIEMQSALNDIHNIIKEADGVMIARGDLGVNSDLTKLPLEQKRIAHLARYVYKKPCIVATQMLESMVKNPVPTRAEVTDISTAVYDGADAVMLSAESATGNYPLESVIVQRKIIDNVTNNSNYYFTISSLTNSLETLDDDFNRLKLTRTNLEDLKNKIKRDRTLLMDEINSNYALNQIVEKIVEIISNHTVDMIALFTNNVVPVNWIAASRTGVPVFAFVPENISRIIQLVWGVNPIEFNMNEFEKAKETSLRFNSLIDGINVKNDVFQRAMDFMAVERAKKLNTNNLLVISTPKCQTNPDDSFYLKLLNVEA